jgi:hypothetical protein
MTLFESLVIGHILGDWLLQTEWQAENKAESWKAMFAHVAVSHAVILIILIIRFGAVATPVYAAVAGLAFTHALLDRKWPVAWLMRALRISVHRPPERTLTLVVDQSLHFLLLAGAALYLSWQLGTASP